MKVVAVILLIALCILVVWFAIDTVFVVAKRIKAKKLAKKNQVNEQEVVDNKVDE